MVKPKKIKAENFCLFSFTPLFDGDDKMEAEKRNKGAVNMSMTGDAYILPLEISFESGKATLADFLEIEVTVGSVRKTLSSGDITYDEESGDFDVRFTQEDTFKLKGKRDVDVRLVLVNEDVIGVKAGTLEHIESQSKQVL